MEGADRAPFRKVKYLINALLHAQKVEISIGNPFDYRLLPRL